MALKNTSPCLDREVPWYVSPFEVREADDVHECLVDMAKKGRIDPTGIVRRWWPVLQEAADTCALNLSFDALRSDDPKPMRQMRRSLQCIQKTGIIPKKFKHKEALEYGARRVGLNGDLSQLPQTQIRVAAKASLAHGPINDQIPGNTTNILFDIGGRPSSTLWCRRKTYPAVLTHIYRRITGKMPGYSTSPDGITRSGIAVHYFTACLAPFYPSLTPEAVVGIIRKIRKTV
ncbi:MAG: hypothetical protein HN578_20660 [Rhodospirillales bacterium]|jgi:hypothetical protein|nr:hypothetical protein [Rhodospirillales bacterium]